MQVLTPQSLSPSPPTNSNWQRELQSDRVTKSGKRPRLWMAVIRTHWKILVKSAILGVAEVCLVVVCCWRSCLDLCLRARLCRAMVDTRAFLNCVPCERVGLCRCYPRE